MVSIYKYYSVYRKKQEMAERRRDMKMREKMRALKEQEKEKVRAQLSP